MRVFTAIKSLNGFVRLFDTLRTINRTKDLKMDDPPTTPPNAFARATQTATHIRTLLPSELQFPKVAIVCGSGLGGLADTIEPEPKVELAYGDIPNFPQSTGKHVTVNKKVGSVLVRMLNCCSARSRGKVCVWADGPGKDAGCVAGGTGTVSIAHDEIKRHKDANDGGKFLRRTLDGSSHVRYASVQDPWRRDYDRFVRLW